MIRRRVLASLYLLFDFAVARLVRGSRFLLLFRGPSA